MSDSNSTSEKSNEDIDDSINDDQKRFEDLTAPSSRISPIVICIIIISVILLEGFLRTYFGIDVFGVALSLIQYVSDFVNELILPVTEFIKSIFSPFSRIFGFFGTI